MPPRAKPASRRPNAAFAALGFAVLIGGLLALVLAFDAPRVALRESMDELTPIKRGRLVYVETEPVGAALSTGGVDDGYLALKFRIGLPHKRDAKQLEQAMPQFYGEMLRDFTRDPLVAEAETGRLDLLSIEDRVRAVLDGLLGRGAVDTVRVIEARRHPI